MATTDTPGTALNAATITRRVLFFVLLISLSLIYLLIMFRGLSSPKGMEQAQIGRELARNNGYTTKMIRPVAVHLAKQATDDQATLVDASRDTYHAPLHPILLAAVLKMVGGQDADKYRMSDKDTVYKLDRIISATCVICFLMAIGVNYLLISRIFDAKIAGVTALLMLLCDLNWQFSQTGLPQMFMLLLFSCACFFAYRAVENSAEGRLALIPALAAGAFFGLLAITHWLAIWIILGFAVYAAFFIRPRGVTGLTALGFVLVLSAWPMMKNSEYSGSPGGTAMLALYNGLGGSEDRVMRTYDLGSEYLPLENLPFKIVRTILLQANDLYVNLGSILTAPLFFLALLHPFKRTSIAHFRWCLLLMWIFGAVGMSIFGLSGTSTDPNQLHILFAPLFAAYGLAFVAILWSRLKLPTEVPQLANAHFILVVLISAGPLVLSLPREVRSGLAGGGAQVPHWPPYFPTVLNTRLVELTLEKEIIVSDQPWAVAWYADRRSLWLPNKIEVFNELQKEAAAEGTPFAGILISPYSHSMKPAPRLYGPNGEYSEFAPLVLDSWASQVLRQRPGTLAGKDPAIAPILAQYPHAAPLVNSLLIYWSAEPIYGDR